MLTVALLVVTKFHEMNDQDLPEADPVQLLSYQYVRMYVF